MLFFKFCFRLQLKIQSFLYAKRQFITDLERYLEIITAVFLFMTILPISNLNIMFYSILICFCLLIILNSLIIINQVLTSLRKFLAYGILYEIMLSLIFSIILITILRLKPNSWVETTIIVVTPIFTWFFLSLIANNKVSKMANLILSTLLGIIVYLKDLFFDFLPDSLFSAEPEIIAQIGYSNKQVYELFFNLVLTPILITNILAALLCELKSYWIEKYNNGEDITLELIKQQSEK